MLRCWTFVGVAYTRISFRWYLELLGLPPADPAHDHCGQTCDAHARW